MHRVIPWRFKRVWFTQSTRRTPSVAVFGDAQISEKPVVIVMPLRSRMVFTRSDVPKKLQIRAALSQVTTPRRVLRRKRIRWVDHAGSFWRVGGQSLFWEQVADRVLIDPVSPLAKYWSQLCGGRMSCWVVGRQLERGITQ